MNLPFSIGEELKSSLKLLEQGSIITNEVLKQILDLSLKSISGGDAFPNFNTVSSSKPHLIKELFAGLTNLVIQITKYELQKDKIDDFCVSVLNINPNFVEIITAFCLENRNAIRDKLSRFVTITQPMLIDVSWKLDYIVKTSEEACVDAGPIYRIRLATVKYNPKTNLNEPYYKTFNCDLLELTDLVSKLKDATRHVERLTYNNNN